MSVKCSLLRTRLNHFNMAALNFWLLVSAFPLKPHQKVMVCRLQTVFNHWFYKVSFVQLVILGWIQCDRTTQVLKELYFTLSYHQFFLVWLAEGERFLQKWFEWTDSSVSQSWSCSCWVFFCRITLRVVRLSVFFIWQTWTQKHNTTQVQVEGFTSRNSSKRQARVKQGNQSITNLKGQQRESNS